MSPRKFHRTITLPATWTVVNGDRVERTPPTAVNVEITIDMDALAQYLALRARRSKRLTCKIQDGIIVGRLVHTEVFP